METLIYIVRHGETAENAANIWQGQLDTELSPIGLRQAEAVARSLKDVPFGAVYASDLKRARVTAGTIAREHGLPVQLEPRLREVNVGRWSGLNYAEARQRDPEVYARLMADPVNTCRPDGESWADLQRRVTLAFHEIAAAHPNDTVCVVGHGGTIRALLADALQLGFESARRLAMDNTGVTIIAGSGEKWRLRLFNDTHHISGSVDEGKWPEG